MQPIMPNLEIGKIYQIKAMENYFDELSIILASRNEYAAVVGFFGERMEDIILEYREIPFASLAQEIQKKHDIFQQYPEHWNRVLRVKEILKLGGVAWPLLTLKKYSSPVCAGNRIHEGMHRAVAHQLLGSQILPLFVMRYVEDVEGPLWPED